MKKTLALILSTVILLVGMPIISASAQTEPSVLQTNSAADAVQDFVNNNINNNLLLGLNPTLQEEGTSWTFDNENKEWNVLTDGNYISGDAANRKTIFSSGLGNGILRISYNLGKCFNITELLTVCRENNVNGYGFDYEIYVAESFEALYNPESLVFAKTYDVYSEAGQLISFSAESEIVGSFVGFRLVEECNNQDTKFHIGELGVYGVEMLTVTDSAEQAQAVKDFAANNAADNLLADITPTAVDERADGGFQDLNIEQPFSNLTDGDYATRMSIFKTNEGIGVYRFTYTLAQRTEISDLLVVCREDKVNDYGFDYEIYLSDQIDNLYSEENLVFKKTKDEYSGGGQHISFPKDIRPCGSYIGFRINDYAGTQPGGEYRYHISEFGVYGTKAKPIPVVYQTSSNPDVFIKFFEENLEKNLIKGLVPAVVEEETTMEVGYFAGEWSSLGDGDYSTKVLVGTTGKGNGVLRYTYTLNEEVAVSDFMVVIPDNDLGLFALKYEVYVGNDAETLYDSENLIFSKDYENYIEGGQLVNLPEEIRPTGKYIGFRLIDSPNKYQLGELGVYGASEITVENETSLQLTASEDAEFEADTVNFNKDYLFKFAAVEDGLFTVEHQLTGLYLTANNGKVCLAERNDANKNQLWRADDVSELYGAEGLFDLVSSVSGLAVNAGSGELILGEASAAAAADGRSWVLGVVEDGLVSTLGAYNFNGTETYLSVNKNLWGDVNKDGERDIRDLIALKKMSVGIVEITAEADLDADGDAAAAGDTVIIRKALLGLSLGKPE